MQVYSLKEHVVKDGIEYTMQIQIIKTGKWSFVCTVQTKPSKPNPDTRLFLDFSVIVKKSKIDNYCKISTYPKSFRYGWDMHRKQLINICLHSAYYYAGLLTAAAYEEAEYS